MTDERKRELDIMSLSRASDGVKLVRQASDNYRRVATRLDRARKAIARAEADFRDAKRGLELAIRAVQPELPDSRDDELLHDVPCCAVFDAYAEKPIHSDDCVAR